MTSNIQPAPEARLCFLVALLLAGLWLGCERDAPPASRQAEVRFGDAYEILTAASPADPDVLPALAGDTLVALVGYSGGCEDHAFDLQYRTLRDTTQLWLEHDARGDACEAYLTEEMHLPVPQEALQPSTVVLLNPQGGPPHILRWHRE